MADDYIAMQTRIANEITDTALTAEVKLAIQDAIRHYQRKRFYFNQKTITFSTVAGQEFYGSAAHADIPNLIQIDTMKVTLGTSKLDVNSAENGDINSAQSTNFTGLPQVFAYGEQQIRLYPIPDAIYTITAKIHYRLTTLSADADTNAWMTDGEQLIRQAAKRFLAADVTKEDAEAGRAGPIEQDALTALLRETKLRRSNHRLRFDPELASGGGFNINTGL